MGEDACATRRILEKSERMKAPYETRDGQILPFPCPSSSITLIPVTTQVRRNP